MCNTKYDRRITYLLCMWNYAFSVTVDRKEINYTQLLLLLNHSIEEKTPHFLK